MLLADPLLHEIVLALRHGRGADAPAEATRADGPRGPGAPGPDADRRRAARQELGVAVRYSRYGAADAAVRAVRLRDISACGVGLLMPDATVAPGELLVVHLPRWGADGIRAQCLDVLCTVRSVRVGRDGRMRVGAEFTSADQPGRARLTAAAAGAVGESVRTAEAPQPPPDAALWGSTAERHELQRGVGSAPRSRPRVPLRGTALLCACAGDGTQGPPEPVRLVDYSPGGVGFLRASPPATGDQFIVSVPLPGGAAVTRLCEVANVAPAEGGVSRVGARFVPFSARHGRGWLARVCDWIA